MLAGMFAPRGGGSPPPTFARWSTTDKSAQIVLSGSDLIATLASPVSYYNTGRADIALTGKSYWEVSLSRLSGHAAGDNVGVGIATSSLATTGGSGTTGYLGGNTTSTGLWDDGSVVRGNAVVTTAILPSDPITCQFAFDEPNLRLWIGVIGLGWIGGGNPATNTLPTINMAAGSYFPAWCGTNNTQAVNANFGQGSFAGAVPSGYKAGVYS